MSKIKKYSVRDFPDGSPGKESVCNAEDSEDKVQSLGWEDPWRKKWQPTPVFLAWRIPWTEEPGGLQSMAHKESDTTKHVYTGPDTHPRYVLIKKEFLLKEPLV